MNEKKKGNKREKKGKKRHKKGEERRSTANFTEEVRVYL
jgi:hypothetical protein